MADASWDHAFVLQMRDAGLTDEQACYVTGLVAEHRQMAYLQGFESGERTTEKNVVMSMCRTAVNCGSSSSCAVANWRREAIEHREQLEATNGDS